MPISASRRALLKGLVFCSTLPASLSLANVGSQARLSNQVLISVDVKLAALLKEFLNRHVSSSGLFTDTYHGVSHTEGIGVSLLFCAWLQDWKRFELVFQRLQAHKRPDGLYSWKAKNGRVLDPNNASDGELYILWALKSAQARGFKATWVAEQASELESAIVSRLLVITSHGRVLKPGVQGFVDERNTYTVNLSYVLLPLIEALARTSPDKKVWADLRDTFLNMSAYAYFGDYGLPADWMDLSDPVAPSSKAEFQPRFSYDAVRVPLFLMWAGQKSHPVVRRVKSFYETTGKSWVDLRTGELSPYGLNSSQRNLLEWISGKSVVVSGLASDYYQASLQLLILAASLGVVL